MGNFFVNLPVPSSNSSGAPVDVSAMGQTKSIVMGGNFVASVNIEYATDVGGTVWAPLTTFQGPGSLTIDVAAHWMRATTANYKSGSANCDVGGSDAGTSFVQIVAPAGNGAGAPVAIDALPPFKTVVVSGPFTGSLTVEVSEDGTDYAQAMTFYRGGAQSASFYGAFARIRRNDVAGGSTPTIWMGASSAGGGGVAPTTEHVGGVGGVDPSVALNPAVDTSFIENTGATETTQDFTLANGTVDGQIHSIVNDSLGTRGVRVLPTSLRGGTTLSVGLPNASLVLIWNATDATWCILGTMLGFTLT